MFKLAEEQNPWNSLLLDLLNPPEKQPNIVPWIITSALRRWNQNTSDIMTTYTLRIEWSIGYTVSMLRLYMESACHQGLFKYSIKTPFRLQWNSPLSNIFFKHICTHRHRLFCQLGTTCFDLEAAQILQIPSCKEENITHWCKISTSQASL